jgi:hypothetical protein
MARFAFALAIGFLLLLDGTTGAVVITGNTGPGGFERTDVASDLKVWLRTDSITGVADGGAVSNWPNSVTFAGAGTAATQGTAGRQPTFENGAGDLLNGNSVVRFGTTDADALTGTVSVGAAKTFFLVIKDTGSPGSCCNGGITTRSSGVMSGLETINRSGDRKLFGDKHGGGVIGTSTINDTPVVGTLIYTLTSTELYRDGAADGSAGYLGGVGNDYQIGSRYTSYPGEHGRYFKGDMAETGVFNRVLNTAERQTVENALAARYGLSTANEHYTGDATAQGHYDQDVFGIGQVDSANPLASAGQAGFGFEAVGATLGDGEWLFAGHKTPANSLVGIEGISGVRWDRVWYVDVTGDLDATFAFDFSDGGLGTAATDRSYELLYSPTNAFAWQTVAEGGLSADLVTFNLSGLADADDGYYTLGVLPVPEPTTILIWSLLAGLGIGVGWRRRK